MTRRDLHLDPDDLARLRDAVRRAQEPQPSVDHKSVLAVHDAAPADAALTVDFAAAQELGMPLLVVRMPIVRRPSPILNALTPREFEVAGYVAGGLANKEIAARLAIRESTVKEHVHRILAKTELPGRAAVARATRAARSRRIPVVAGLAAGRRRVIDPKARRPRSRCKPIFRRRRGSAARDRPAGRPATVVLPGSHEPTGRRCEEPPEVP